MLLQISFIHFYFLKKKKINSSIIKNKIEFLYCLLLKKTLQFFLTQEIKYAIYRRIDPKWSYNLQLNIPDKTLFNLVIFYCYNILNSLKIVKNLNFFNAGLRQTRYTVLRSPFVHKESREQYCFKYYKGKIKCNLFITNYLINDFIRTFFVEKLKRLSSFEIKQVKKIRLLY
jgi:hypothetical protein